MEDLPNKETMTATLVRSSLQSNKLDGSGNYVFIILEIQKIILSSIRKYQDHLPKVYFITQVCFELCTRGRDSFILIIYTFHIKTAGAGHTGQDVMHMGRLILSKFGREGIIVCVVVFVQLLRGRVVPSA